MILILVSWVADYDSVWFVRILKVAGVVTLEPYDTVTPTHVSRPFLQINRLFRKQVIIVRTKPMIILNHTFVDIITLHVHRYLISAIMAALHIFLLLVL